MQRRNVYLDYQATCPLDSEVYDAMMPFFKEHYGNPSSIQHAWGRKAQNKATEARESIAQSIGADTNSLLFTSGATESINLAIKGVAEFYEKKGKHIISSYTEHKASLEVLFYLQKKGFEVTFLECNQKGELDLDQLKKSIREDTILISLMYANNEIGTLHPVKEIAELARKKGVFFHCDASQAFSTISINIKDTPIDLMSFSSHKIYGPKGIGALYLSRKKPRVRLSPLIHGGGQELDLRSGTLNVPAIVGFAKAFQILDRQRIEDNKNIALCRDAFLNTLQQEKKCQFKLIGPDFDNRIISNLNICFQGIYAASLIQRLQDLAISNGSACSTYLSEPSHVLKTIGLSLEDSESSIRISFGRMLHLDEAIYAAKRISEEVTYLKMNPSENNLNPLTCAL